MDATITIISYSIYHSLLTRALGDDAKHALDAALSAFDADGCPGVPTWVVNDERFWGKDRVDWLVDKLQSLLASQRRQD